MDRKDVALSVGAALASMVVAYLIYKMQQRDSLIASQNAANASAQDSSNQYQQASYLAALPSINTSTPAISYNDVAASPAQTYTPASDPTLSSILGGFFGGGSQSIPGTPIGGGGYAQPISSLIAPIVVQPTPDPTSGGVMTQSVAGINGPVLGSANLGTDFTTSVAGKGGPVLGPANLGNGGVNSVAGPGGPSSSPADLGVTRVHPPGTIFDIQTVN